MSCQDCKYFNDDDELHCAVNPIAAEGYHPDRPNDCNDFHLASHQDSSTDFSLNQTQTWLTEQRQQFDTYQRQLASSSQQIAQLRSETCQVQSEIHRLSIQLHQLNCEQIELENRLSEFGSQRQVAQQERQKQLEHLQCLASEIENKVEREIEKEIEKERKLTLMESGEMILITSISVSMVLLSFNHRLMASSAAAFGLGATTLSYGYALYPRKLD